jgi:hypothetical protein
MTTAADYSLTEIWFWQMVTLAVDLLGGEKDKADSMRMHIVSLPWERRRYFYNSSPIEIAEDLAGIVATQAQKDEYRRIEQALIGEIDLTVPEGKLAPPTATSRNRVAAAG